MINGIVSSSRGGSAAASPYLGFASMDFTTGIYSLNGAAAVLGDLLDRTDMTINANGARFDLNTSDEPARFQAALLTAINANASAMTLVIEVQMVGDESSDQQMIYMTGDSNKSQIELLMSDSYMQFGAAMNKGMNYYADYSTPRLVNTTYRAALCYSPAVPAQFDLPKIAAFNGGLTDYDDSYTVGAYTPAFANGALGGSAANSYLDMNGWIRKVEFYPTAMSEAELIAISSL